MLFFGIKSVNSKTFLFFTRKFLPFDRSSKLFAHLMLSLILFFELVFPLMIPCLPSIALSYNTKGFISNLCLSFKKAGLPQLPAPKRFAAALRAAGNIVARCNIETNANLKTFFSALSFTLSILSKMYESK